MNKENIINNENNDEKEQDKIEENKNEEITNEEQEKDKKDEKKENILKTETEKNEEENTNKITEENGKNDIKSNKVKEENNNKNEIKINDLKEEKKEEIIVNRNEENIKSDIKNKENENILKENEIKDENKKYEIINKEETEDNNKENKEEKEKDVDTGVIKNEDKEENTKNEIKEEEIEQNNQKDKEETINYNNKDDKTEEKFDTDFEIITKEEALEKPEGIINLENIQNDKDKEEEEEEINKNDKNELKDEEKNNENDKEIKVNMENIRKEEQEENDNEENIQEKKLEDETKTPENNDEIIKNNDNPITQNINIKDLETKIEETKENIDINNSNQSLTAIKDTKRISRPSLETNFKIESQTEIPQIDENNNIESTQTPNPSQEQTPNLIQRDKISSNKSISSDKDSQNYQNILTLSECEKELDPGEIFELELNVSSSKEGKVIVKGLEFNLFSQCNIIHLFSKKTSPNLYYYINRKKIFTMGGASHISSSSSSDYESRNSSELVAKSLLLNNIIIPRKNKIEYIVSDFKNDLYVSFPLGTKVNAFLYQMYFFPILIKNNSPNHRVGRYTIFIEESDKNKLKSFNNFITRNKTLKQRGTQDLVFIPLIPMSTGKLYLKILIKFISDLKQSPIQVKRYLIKLKVKESISFEIKEYCSNLKEDKDGKTYNKIDFNIKTNLRIRNEKEIKDLKLKEPLFSKDLNLNNQKSYLITNDEIHKKYVFDKETNYKHSINNNSENKYNFDFIPRIIKENFLKNNDNNFDKENNDFDISYIINKFNKILNNSNSNTIFFPWEATHIKIDNNIENSKEILYGLYPYKLKMKNSETTKSFLSFLFNKFTDLNITTKKIDRQKTLIKMILKLDKIGLASMGDDVEKYEICASDIQKSIIWLGPKNFVVKNNLEETTFTCRFNFITTLKGNIEVNRISVLVYKKSNYKIKINHITKPTSIFIE